MYIYALTFFFFNFHTLNKIKINILYIYKNHFCKLLFNQKKIERKIYN